MEYRVIRTTRVPDGASEQSEWRRALTSQPCLPRAATAGPHHAVLESVVTDHALGAAMAVRHLVSLGHRKVGVLLAEHSPTRMHGRRGWRDAAIECGLGADATVDALVPDARSPESDDALDAILDRCLATRTIAVIVHAAFRFRTAGPPHTSRPLKRARTLRVGAESNVAVGLARRARPAG